MLKSVRRLNPNTRLLLFTAPLIALGLTVIALVYIFASYLYEEAYGPYDAWRDFGLNVQAVFVLSGGALVWGLNAIVAFTFAWLLRKKLPLDARYLKWGATVLLVPVLVWSLWLITNLTA